MGVGAYPNFESFEIIRTGIVIVIPTAAATNWTTVTHNLGYVPIVMSYLNNVGLGAITSSGNIPLPTFTNANVNTTSHIFEIINYMICVADATNIYFVYYNSTGSTPPSLPVKYYLLRERAN